MDAMNPLDAGAIDHEIRTALAVDPSPEFVARIRVGCAEEPRAHSPRAVWALGTLGLAAIAAAVFITARLPQREVVQVGQKNAHSPMEEMPTEPPLTGIATAPTQARQAVRQAWLPQPRTSVIISRREAEALDQVIRAFYAPPINWAQFSVHKPWPDDWLAAIPEIPMIAVAPIAIEPIDAAAQ